MVNRMGESTMQELANAVSFVIPCLNEAQTLPLVLRKIRQLSESDLKACAVEMLVVDNGSTDCSVELAKREGARVLSCVEKGYGAALRFGIANATHPIVIFADADNTYDLLEAPRLLAELEQGADLVLGSRLRGDIKHGAMPFSHRHIGTPVLTSMINHLYGGHGRKLTDCNSGFRCFWKDQFLSWGVKSTGMEFASEMLVKALIAEARTSEVPITLYRDERGRVPHLARWRDGMRHVLQILLESPRFFFTVGTVTWLISWLVLLTAARTGLVTIGGVTLMGLHTMMFGLLFSVVGITIFGIGLNLSARHPVRKGVYGSLLNLKEDRLFWGLVSLGLLSFAGVLLVVGKWVVAGFSNISLERITLVLIAFSTNGLIFIANTFAAHLMKRST